jgi:hypothetical protein
MVESLPLLRDFVACIGFVQIIGRYAPLVARALGLHGLALELSVSNRSWVPKPLYKVGTARSVHRASLLLKAVVPKLSASNATQVGIRVPVPNQEWRPSNRVAEPSRVQSLISRLSRALLMSGKVSASGRPLAGSRSLVRGLLGQPSLDKVNREINLWMASSR